VAMMVTYSHIQTVMINMKSHRHGMYLPLLLKLFSLVLKCCFIPKTVTGGCGALCIFLAVYIVMK
jgi:hypothetical protein